MERLAQIWNRFWGGSGEQPDGEERINPLKVLQRGDGWLSNFVKELLGDWLGNVLAFAAWITGSKISNSVEQTGFPETLSHVISRVTGADERAATKEWEASGEKNVALNEDGMGEIERILGGPEAIRQIQAQYNGIINTKKASLHLAAYVFGGAFPSIVPESGKIDKETILSIQSALTLPKTGEMDRRTLLVLTAYARQHPELEIPNDKLTALEAFAKNLKNPPTPSIPPAAAPATPPGAAPAPAVPVEKAPTAPIPVVIGASLNPTAPPATDDITASPKPKIEKSKVNAFEAAHNRRAAAILEAWRKANPEAAVAAAAATPFALTPGTQLASIPAGVPPELRKPGWHYAELRAKWLKEHPANPAASETATAAGGSDTSPAAPAAPANAAAAINNSATTSTAAGAKPKLSEVKTADAKEAAMLDALLAARTASNPPAPSPAALPATDAEAQNLAAYVKDLKPAGAKTLADATAALSQHIVPETRPTAPAAPGNAPATALPADVAKLAEKFVADNGNLYDVLSRGVNIPAATLPAAKVTAATTPPKKVVEAGFGTAISSAFNWLSKKITGGDKHDEKPKAPVILPASPVAAPALGCP